MKKRFKSAYTAVKIAARVGHYISVQKANGHQTVPAL